MSAAVLDNQNQNVKGLPYCGLLGVLFYSWDRAALAESIERAREWIAKEGSAAKAMTSIEELAFGNVSLRAKAYFRPIHDVLSAIDKGFV